jgi:putative SOS response-associated peptidase YedK
MAGLWETWRSPEGERIRSFTIATTTPNELCAKLHNRMPVVLKPEAWPMWLGEEPADPAHLKALLAPLPFRGHDLLAGHRARRQRQKQRSVADRADCFAVEHLRPIYSVFRRIFRRLANFLLDAYIYSSRRL